MALYQEIMNVPGLSGNTWQERLRDFYAKAGLDLGKFGSYDENVKALNLIRQNNYYPNGLGGSPTPVQETPQQAYGGTNGAELGQQAGQANAITPWTDILSFDDFFIPELVKGGIRNYYSSYYAPMVQNAQENAERAYANRNLTRSGIRSKGISDMYNDYRRQLESSVLDTFTTDKTNASGDYNLLQEDYEKSGGANVPKVTKYESSFNVASPKTDAGTYGQKYLDWVNSALNN